jgi:tetratricopeptide (TPR) repeat protein/tRNA A-37 threonylcarbamoyl transferase component Bud32
MAIDCAHDADLEGFVEGRLRGAELLAVERALDGCATCRQRVGDLARREERPPPTRSDPVPDPFEPIPDPYVGAVLGGRYRVLGMLGRGGMGVVYDAEHVLIGRRVAVKILHPELAARRELLQRFRSEARAAGAIGHPGIVQALDVGRSENGAPFLVLERLEGRDLETELAARGPLPIGEALELGVAVADAVAAAHALGIVHRDLKPANLFLTTTRAVKVLDFGISKIRGELQTSPDTQSGVLLGTPAYMAPEQMRDAGAADARADVYALCAILYRALTGELPRSAVTLRALAVAAANDPAPSARARRPEVREDLDALLRRGLAAAPEARPASMAELRDALRSMASSTHRTSVRPLGAIERRMVIALVVEEVDPDGHPLDFGAVEQLAVDAGARRAPSDPQVFLLGDESWSGAVIADAGRLAMELAAHGARVCVGPATRVGAALERSTELTELSSRAPHERGAFLAPSLALSDLGELVRGPDGRLSGGAPRSDRTPTRLLGRAAELASIDEAVELVLHTRRPVVASVIGPPGIGKSHLLAALVPRLEAHGLRVLRASGRPGSDLHVLRSAIASFAAIDDRADPELRRLALAGVLATACDAHRAQELAPDLERLVGMGAREGRDASARLLGDRVRVAAREILEGLAAHRPLALLVDDGQWADAASCSVLDALSRAPVPLVLVLAGRSVPPESPWLEHGDVVRVGPRPLRTPETRRLLGELLGPARADEVAERIQAHTGGNPLFVEQLGRALAHEGAGAELPLLPSIEGAVQAQLDVLDPDARELLRRAAVLNEPFTTEDLAALGVEHAAPALARLVTEGLARLLTDGRHALATPLLAEAAYRTLDDEVRTELHRCAASRLEGRAAPELVGWHLERGGLPRRAAEAYARACSEARAAGDPGRTIACAERALALGSPDPLPVRIVLAEAYEAQARTADQLAVLEVAEAECAPGSARSRIRVDLAFARSRLGRPGALDLLAAAVAEADDDPPTLARALGVRAVLLGYAGRADEASEHLRHAERVVLTRAPALRADSIVWRAHVSAAAGDLGEARNAFWAAAEVYREQGDLRRASEATVNLAEFYNRVGAYDEAIPALRAAIDGCRRTGSRVQEGYGWHNLAFALMGEGRLDEAEAALDEAARLATLSGDVRLATVSTLYRAKLLTARGEPDAAAALARDVAERARERGARAMEALARIVLARAELHARRVESALAEAETALAIVDAHGGIEEGGGALFAVLVAALEALGRLDEAARVRARARATLEMLAVRIGDRHWRERFLGDVEDHRALLGAAP